jgi:hypothetical protein
MTGNREKNEAEIMDFDENGDVSNDVDMDPEHGQWNAVGPKEQPKIGKAPSEIEDVTILDEEPEVTSVVAAAPIFIWRKEIKTDLATLDLLIYKLNIFQ